MKRKRIKAVLERCASGFLAFMMLFSSINATVLAEIPDTGSTPEPTAETLQDSTTETPEDNKTAEEAKEEEKATPAVPEEKPTEVSQEPEKESEEEVPVPENEPSKETEEAPEEEDSEKESSEEEKADEAKEEAEEALPALEVYVAENAADMAAAVASLSDDSTKRIVVETETDLKAVVGDSGKAVYYDGSYVITMDDSTSVDAALWQINEAEGETKAVRDDRITICENDGVPEEGSSIGESIDTDTAKAAEEGLSLHDVTDSTSTKKLVALIDTGVNGDLAAKSVNLTDDSDEDANGHGTRMAQAISQASDGRAVILSIKAFNNDGTASLANVYAAVKYAIEAKADIINISASVPDSANTAALRNMITEAMNSGISVVVAAGNAHTDAAGFFPANVDGVIAVGAVSEEGTLVETSNYGDCVKLYVIAGSTSLAAAKLSGFKAADKVDGNPEIYFGVVPGAGSSQTLPVADPKDPSKLYVNDDCYTAPGCKVTKERAGWYNGHYITFFHADNASFLCYDENTLFKDGYYIITSYNITFTITNVSTLSILSDAGELVKYEPGEMVTTIKTHYDNELGKYVACTENKALPYGTYTIQETKTNNAYLLTDGTPRTFEIEKDGEVVWTDVQTHHDAKEGEAMIFRNQIIRGEFEFVKIMSRVTERMQTLWVLENATSGEKHVIVTDPNGEYHSNEFPHSQDTNGNDGLLEKIEKDGYEKLISLTAGLEDGSILEYHGLWFGRGEDGDMAEVNDNLSSLPDGQYNLHEVRTDTNEGSELQNLAFYVTRDNKLIHLGTITDYQITLQTVATDKESGTHYMKPGTSSVIVDKVTYHGIEEFGYYTLKSYLVDSETAEPIVDATGREVSVTTNLQLTKADGKIDVELAFDSSNLGGKQIVVFEELYNAKGERVSSHMDPLDSNQTVTIPGIGTKIADVTAGKEDPKDRVIYLKDTVSYNGLVAGTEYTMTGTLMDKATGAPFAGAEPVTKAFTPRVSSGTVEIEFEVDAAQLSGKTVVAFESCSRDGVEVAVHADINDVNQTYEYHGPQLHTTATDEDGDHTASAAEELKILDKVQYKNLTVGKEYELRGTLHIKNADGSDAGTYTNADGSDYVVTKTFTPTQTDDFVTIEFTVDASELVERSLVVFEELYQVEKLVTVHADITDKDQTVDIEKPTIRTTATNKADNGKTILDRGPVTIHDEVIYTGLVAGKTYTLAGTLHTNKDGKDAGVLKIEGKEVTNTITFVPEKSSGSVGMDFTFNSKEITGTSRVVAFETLKLGEKEVAVHADITDEGQTVTFTVKPPEPPTPPTPPVNPEYPEIHTTAYSAKDGYDYVSPVRTVTIRDRVYYNNLTPGVEYELRGELHKKNAGGWDDGILFVNGQYVTSSIRFTPIAKSGYVELSFTFDATALNEVTTVAFERLYHQGIEITSHTDINDEEQTILITRNPKYRRRRAAWINTGVGKDLLVYGGTGIAAAAACIYLLRKKKEEEAVSKEAEQQ